MYLQNAPAMKGIFMRAHGQAKLGFYPLPPAEANRLKNWLNLPEQFSPLHPCLGDGIAFAHLLGGAPSRRYGIEIDAYRADQARPLGIETLQADTMEVRCPAESLSMLYLNPPYDWEAGSSNNQSAVRAGSSMRTNSRARLSDMASPRSPSCWSVKMVLP